MDFTKFVSLLDKESLFFANFKNLTECFLEEKPKVSIGKVCYLNYNNDSIPWGTDGLKIYKPFMYKRRSFEHEREIRAIVFVSNNDKSNIKDYVMEYDGEKNEIMSGIYVPVSMGLLIEKIYVFPGAPKWFFDLVKSVSNKYGLDKEVTQSNLYSRLIY
jgi:hypothetical protein